MIKACQHSIAACRHKSLYSASLYLVVIFSQLRLGICKFPESLDPSGANSENTSDKASIRLAALREMWMRKNILSYYLLASWVESSFNTPLILIFLRPLQIHRSCKSNPLNFFSSVGRTAPAKAFGRQVFCPSPIPSRSRLAVDNYLARILFIFAAGLRLNENDKFRATASPAPTPLDRAIRLSCCFVRPDECLHQSISFIYTLLIKPV